MKLTAEQLTEFLDARRRRVAAIVTPDDVEAALAEVHARMKPQLSRAGDEKSLDSFVNVYAVDFALKRYYSQFRGDDAADSEPFAGLLAWNNGYVEGEIAKTIRVHLFHLDDAPLVAAETNITLWELRMSFNRDFTYVAWARGIARNKARSHRPFDKRNLSIDTSADKPVDIPAQGLSPEDKVVEKELAIRWHGPPPQAYVELLQMLSNAEPHKAIAFLFHRYLRMKPAEIAASIRDMSLTEAFAEVSRLIRERYPEIAGIEAILAPLAGRVAVSEGKFSDYVADAESMAKHIGRWGESTLNSLGDNTVQKGKKFLRFVCGLSAAAHEIVCFLWIRLLYSPPVALQHAAQRPLMRLVVGFEERYARRELLAAEQVEWCVDPLRRRAPEDRSLEDFAGSDLYASLKRWCEHVEIRIAPAAAGEHLLGYAYVTGSLRRGKDKF